MVWCGGGRVRSNSAEDLTIRSLVDMIFVLSETIVESADVPVVVEYF